MQDLSSVSLCLCIILRKLEADASLREGCGGKNIKLGENDMNLLSTLGSKGFMFEEGSASQAYSSSSQPLSGASPSVRPTPGKKLNE